MVVQGWGLGGDKIETWWVHYVSCQFCGLRISTPSTGIGREFVEPRIFLTTTRFFDYGSNDYCSSCIVQQPTHSSHFAMPQWLRLSTKYVVGFSIWSVQWGNLGGTQAMTMKGSRHCPGYIGTRPQYPLPIKVALRQWPPSQVNGKHCTSQENNWLSL